MNQGNKTINMVNRSKPTIDDTWELYDHMVGFHYEYSKPNYNPARTMKLVYTLWFYWSIHNLFGSFVGACTIDKPSRWYNYAKNRWMLAWTCVFSAKTMFLVHQNMIFYKQIELICDATSGGQFVTTSGLHQSIRLHGDVWFKSLGFWGVPKNLWGYLPGKSATAGSLVSQILRQPHPVSPQEDGLDHARVIYSFGNRSQDHDRLESG